MISKQEISSHNSSYDHADDEIWRMLVYKPVHSGWEFTNIGGRGALDAIALRLSALSDPKLLEIGSGLGATCIYLSQKFGYDITGIDINSHQVCNALARVARFPELRIRFIEHDVLTWLPDRQYDCVYSVDSLMLIAETEAVLRKAHGCLAKNGLLAASEMMAGPSITPELRNYALQEDAIYLLPVEGYVERLAGIGFSHIDAIDLTDVAENCFDRIHQTACKSREQFLKISTPRVYESWLKLSRNYRDGFHNRQFEYRMLVAHVDR
jgi:SAM-dependent methyltransferase